MRHLSVLLMSLFTLLSLSVGWAQDVGININMVPATIANGGTGVIQVDICNNDFSITAPANKLRPLISGNSFIEIVSIDNADFTVQSLGTGANNSIRLLYNKTLDPLSCATVNITVRGVAQGGPSTITGTLGFNGPQTAGNDTANDNSTTGVTVSAAATPTPVVTGNNPTSPGTNTGSVSLSASPGTTPYAPNAPVSVTYTAPDGTQKTFTGTTDGTGKITIPGLGAGTYGPFVVSVDGSTPSAPSNTVVLRDPAATPVATGNNPTSPGTATGSVSLTGASGPYPANTPVSVTYTTPNGPAVYTGTTDPTGKITIPNLPAGTYGPFTVSVNGGPASAPGGSATLTDPVPAPTPVAQGNNPTSPGTPTGSVSLSASPGTTPYAPNRPVSVTYTSPNGTPVVYTGTTDPTGKITIPNLPAGTYGPFVVSVDGGPASAPSNRVTLTDPVPASTPVATGTNPTSPGTSTGSVSLTASPGTTPYPANTPVSVTYTSPNGTPVVYTGTTDPTGKITIPNLPAGTYDAFKVSVNGGPASSPSNPVTLTDPVPASTPVATGSNPTSPGTATGSVSLSASPGTTPYPANTPVSVTYTTPSGGTATYTGTTDPTGKIVIPNLPAGTYGPFVVSVNGGTPSAPSNTVTLRDPAATPVATGTNPTTPGTSTGSVSLSASPGSTPYPANTPVSVTYTSPNGTPVVYTGTTDGTGKITIPNLPAGTYGPFVVSVNGGPASAPSNRVTLTDPAASTPVATGTNPTTPGTSTGSVSLSASPGTTPYPANAPVSVTYTSPNGTPVVYTGTTDPTGKITIPNLPAGTYGPFVVSVNGGPASSPSNTVTLRDQVPTDLTSYTYARPSSVRGTKDITVVVDLEELRGGATSGPITVKVSKGSYIALNFSSGTTSLDNRPVQNSVWSFDASSDPNYYVLTTNAVIAANDVLSFGLTGTLTPGNTSGTIAISTSVVAGSGGDSQPNNNASASKIDYFQQ